MAGLGTSLMEAVVACVECVLVVGRQRSQGAAAVEKKSSSSHSRTVMALMPTNMPRLPPTVPTWGGYRISSYCISKWCKKSRLSF